MKTKLRTLTWSDFDHHEPCYDPEERYGDFSGTILDILRDERIPNGDKIWAFIREGIVDDKTLRLFAVRCARKVQHLMTDERSIHALDVAERYAHGNATAKELRAACDAAWEAARKAARAGVWAAAWSELAAARAACDTAWEAAWKAARGTAERVAAARAAWEQQVTIAVELIKEFYEV